MTANRNIREDLSIAHYRCIYFLNKHNSKLFWPISIAGSIVVLAFPIIRNYAAMIWLNVMIYIIAGCGALALFSLILNKRKWFFLFMSARHQIINDYKEWSKLGLIKSVFLDALILIDMLMNVLLGLFIPLLILTFNWS
jgi:hypothetical protein